MASRSSSIDEDEEVFEITDFTTASDWEKFIAELSEAITSWQLSDVETLRPLRKSEISKGKWIQLTKEIR